MQLAKKGSAKQESVCQKPHTCLLQNARKTASSNHVSWEGWKRPSPKWTLSIWLKSLNLNLIEKKKKKNLPARAKISLAWLTQWWMKPLVSLRQSVYNCWQQWQQSIVFSCRWEKALHFQWDLRSFQPQALLNVPHRTSPLRNTFKHLIKTDIITSLHNLNHVKHWIRYEHFMDPRPKKDKYMNSKHPEYVIDYFRRKQIWRTESTRK